MVWEEAMMAERKIDVRTRELYKKMSVLCTGEKFETIVGAMSIFLVEMIWVVAHEKTSEEHGTSPTHIANGTMDQFKEWVMAEINQRIA
jgi:hypothetical protein